MSLLKIKNKINLYILAEAGAPAVEKAKAFIFNDALRYVQNFNAFIDELNNGEVSLVMIAPGKEKNLIFPFAADMKWKYC